MSCCLAGLQSLLQAREDQEEQNEQPQTGKSKSKLENGVLGAIPSSSSSGTGVIVAPRGSADTKKPQIEPKDAFQRSSQNDDLAAPLVAKLLVRNAGLQAEAQMVKDNVAQQQQMREYIRSAQEALAVENEKLRNELQSENMRLRADLIRTQEQLASMQLAEGYVHAASRAITNPDKTMQYCAVNNIPADASQSKTPARAKKALIAGLLDGTVAGIVAQMEQPSCKMAGNSVADESSKTLKRTASPTVHDANCVHFELAQTAQGGKGSKTQVYRNIRSGNAVDATAKVDFKEVAKDRTPSTERPIKYKTFREPRAGSKPCTEQVCLDFSSSAATASKLHNAQSVASAARVPNRAVRKERRKPEVLTQQPDANTKEGQNELPLIQIHSDMQPCYLEEEYNGSSLLNTPERKEYPHDNSEHANTLRHVVLGGSPAGAKAMAQEQELRRIGSAPGFDLPSAGGSAASSGRRSAPRDATRRKPTHQTYSPEPRPVPIELATSVLEQRNAMSSKRNQNLSGARKRTGTSPGPPGQRSRSFPSAGSVVARSPVQGQSQNESEPRSFIGHRIHGIHGAEGADVLAAEGTRVLAAQFHLDSPPGSPRHSERVQQRSHCIAPHGAELGFLESVQVTAGKAVGEVLGGLEARRAQSEWEIPVHLSPDSAEPYAKRSLAPNSRMPVDDIRSVRQAHGHPSQVRAAKRGPLLPQPLRGTKLTPSTSEPVLVGVVSRSSPKTLVTDPDFSTSSIALTEEMPSMTSDSPFTNKSGSSRGRVRSPPQRAGSGSATKTTNKLKRNDSAERRLFKSSGRQSPPMTPLKADQSQAIRTSPRPAGAADPIYVTHTDPERGVIEYLRFGGWQEMWPGGEAPRGAVRHNGNEIASATSTHGRQNNSTTQQGHRQIQPVRPQANSRRQ